MKTTLISIWLAFCSVFLSFAQVVPDAFGTVKPDYLSMKSYSADPLAEAVVLYDIGKTRFVDSDYGFRIVFERTRKIKILSKAGIDYANIEIPYYVENLEMERVYDLDGYTFNFENGSLRRTRLDPKTSFDERQNDHWMVKKFAMPEVKDGSVIEYTYKIESPYFVNLYDWQFQSRIPTIYSEYTVGMIPFYEYSYIFQGAKKFDVFKNTQSALKRNFNGTEYPDNIFTFGMKNIAAFRDEAFITSINDYIMKMDFQLAVVHHPNGANVEYMTTWPLLNEKLLKENDFGIYIKNASKTSQELLPSVCAGKETSRDKAESIFNYIKANYNWDGYSTKFTGKSLKEFVKTKSGNTADINLFLCGMLREAGISAFPVLLSTRSHGKIPNDFPFHHFMNYVIVMVNCEGNRYFLDATEPFSPFGVLPARCINDKGLIVDKEKTEWVSLSDETVSFRTDSLKIKFNLDSNYVYITDKAIMGGHLAVELRSSYSKNAEEFQKGLIKNEMRMLNPAVAENLSDIGEPFTINYGFAMPYETVSDRILIHPFPGLVPEENELKMNFRSYPVDMIYSKTKTFNTIIEVPDGYQFTQTPNEVNIDNALVNISYKVVNSSGRLLITGRYSYKKAVYLPNEYFELRKMFTTIVETFNSKIILQKSA